MPETALTGNLPDRGSLVLRAFAGGSTVDAPAAEHGSNPLGYAWAVPAVVLDGDPYKILRGTSEPYSGEVGDGTVEIFTAGVPDPVPGAYEPPGLLPAIAGLRSLVAGDDYVAAVGRAIRIPEPSVDYWPQSLGTVSLHIARKPLPGMARTEAVIDGSVAVVEGLRECRFDVPGSVGLEADRWGRPQVYLAAVVAEIADGAAVRYATLARETWEVSDPPGNLPA